MHSLRTRRSDTPGPMLRRLAISLVLGLTAAAEQVLDMNEAQRGLCAEEIRSSCPDVTPGRNRVYTCLTRKYRETFGRGVASAVDLPTLFSEECTGALRSYRVALATHPLSLNYAMKVTCAADTRAYCSGDHREELAVKDCLVENKERLGILCYRALLSVQIASANNIEEDTATHAACTADIDTQCPHVQPGNERVRRCLFAARSRLSAPCATALLSSEAQKADDIRLNPRIQQACGGDVPRFCAGLAPGSGRVLSCLMDHASSPKMSAECGGELHEYQKIQALSYKLDKRIAMLCEDDVRASCSPPVVTFHFGFKSFTQRLESSDGEVLQCLKLKEPELRSEACKAEVNRQIRSTIGSLELSAPLRTACGDDVRQLCPTTGAGAGGAGDQQHFTDEFHLPRTQSEALLCLHARMGQVSTACRAELFKRDVIASHSIDYNTHLASSCSFEMETACAGAPHHGETVTCLQRHLAVQSDKIGARCRTALISFTRKSSSDYRLNKEVYDHCGKDIQRNCESLLTKGPATNTTTFAGSILHCLRSSCVLSLSGASRGTGGQWAHPSCQPLPTGVRTFATKSAERRWTSHSSWRRWTCARILSPWTRVAWRWTNTAPTARGPMAATCLHAWGSTSAISVARAWLSSASTRRPLSRT